MLKYEDLTQKDLKRLSESNFSKITHETSNLYASPNPITKKMRKDAKGIPILKKTNQNAKTLHHLYFVDHLDPSHNLEDVEEIECYKKYNQEGEEEEVEEIIKVKENEDKEVKEEITIDKDKMIDNNIYTQKCCCVF